MKLSEMFPNRFLRGQDMSAPLLIVIRSIVQEKIRAGAGKPEEAKWVLRFDLAKDPHNPSLLTSAARPLEGYGLVLRKSLLAEIFEATHIDDSDKLIAQKIVIFPRTEKRDMISIHARAPKVAAPPPLVADTGCVEAVEAKPAEVAQ